VYVIIFNSLLASLFVPSAYNAKPNPFSNKPLGFCFQCGIVQEHPRKPASAHNIHHLPALTMKARSHPSGRLYAPCQNGGAFLRLLGQELRTGSDKKGDYLIGRLERVRVCSNGGPEIRQAMVSATRKVALHPWREALTHLSCPRVRVRSLARRVHVMCSCSHDSCASLLRASRTGVKTCAVSRLARFNAGPWAILSLSCGSDFLAEPRVDIALRSEESPRPPRVRAASAWRVWNAGCG